MKGQVAIEYIIIVCILIAFLIPIWAYIGGVRQNTESQLTLAYAKNALDSITDAATLVYSQGSPAKVRISVQLPEDIVSSNISGNTAWFTLRTNSGNTDVVSVSTAVLNGTLPTVGGPHWITVEAMQNFVNIIEYTP